MSAFVMKENDIALLARKLVKYIDDNRNYICSPFEHYTKILDRVKDDKRVEYTYNYLYKLNLQSVNYRYDENNSDIPSMPTDIKEVNDYQLIKLINCWQYQSCEDNEIACGTFYREMGEWAGELALSIVQNTDEYSRARWG